MATGNVAWTTTHAEASEPEDKVSSSASGPDTEPNQAFRKWIAIPPGTMTGWISYIEVLQEEVREGRSPYGFIACACTQFTNFQKGWSTEDWNTYLTNFENEVKAGRTSMHLLTISRGMHVARWELHQTSRSRGHETHKQKTPRHLVRKEREDGPRRNGKHISPSSRRRSRTVAHQGTY